MLREITINSLEVKDKLYLLMEIHGLTPNMFAKRIGVSKPTVSRWLNHAVTPKKGIIRKN